MKYTPEEATHFLLQYWDHHFQENLILAQPPEAAEYSDCISAEG